jgi:hypothetical protein
MKDFADIDNSVGAYPNVTAADCTGPGETDGTAVIADTMTDYFGFIQALLEEVNDTPSGSAEEDTNSQILNAIKLLPNVENVPTGRGIWDATDWGFVAASNIPFVLFSAADSKGVYFSIVLPDVPMDLTIEVDVSPGAARAGGNRMRATFFRVAKATSIKAVEIASVYDDGTASTQTITLSKSFTPTATNQYYIELVSGNTGSASPDQVITITVTKDAQ